MVKSLCLVLRLAAYVNAKAAKDLLVLIADDNGEVRLASSQLIKLILCGFCNGVCKCGNCERQKHLVCVETGISVLEILSLEGADRLQYLT